MKRPVVGVFLALAPRWPRLSYYKRMQLFTKIFSGKIFVTTEKYWRCAHAACGAINGIECRAQHLAP